MTTATAPRNLSAELIELQARQSRSRDESCIDYLPTVAGIVIEPISLKTMGRIRAMGVGMAEGIDIEAVAKFVWCCHHRFGQFNVEERRKVYGEVIKALRPRYETFNGIGYLYASLPRFAFLRRFLTPTAAARLAEAAEEMQRLLAEAWKDWPSGSGGDPIPLSSEIYFTTMVRRELGLSFDEIRSMPLRRLSQHLREIIHRSDPKSLALLTKEESAIWEEHLGDPEQPSENN